MVAWRELPVVVNDKSSGYVCVEKAIQLSDGPCVSGLVVNENTCSGYDDAQKATQLSLNVKSDIHQLQY